MNKVRVGICRIYTVKRLKIPGAEEFRVPFTLGGFDITVSLGATTRHEIIKPASSLPEKKRKNSSASQAQNVKSALSSGQIYCEIVSTCVFDVHPVLAARFYAYDKAARTEIFQMADKKSKVLASSLDYVAGFLDLRFEHAGGFALIFEETCAFYNDQSICTPYSPEPKNIGSFEPTKNQDRLAEIIQTHHQRASREHWEKKAQVLSWLLRARSARDFTQRFVLFFFIFERIIPSQLPVGNNNKWQEKRQKILSLVEKHAKPQEVKEITEFVRGLKSRLSSTNRFENWAANMALPGWKEDISTFKFLSEKRVVLINATKLHIEPHAVIQDADVRDMETLTIKYVNLSIFEIKQQKKSSVRPQ